MEAARISETSVDSYFTRQYIPEDKSEHSSPWWWRQHEPLKRRSTVFYTAVHPRRQIWTLIALMMEAARISETSIDSYFTRQYIPEDKSDHSSPWWWRKHEPLKRRSTIILHGSTSQKTNLNTHRPDYGGSTYLWNVGRQLFYTAVHPRRQIWTSPSVCVFPWRSEKPGFIPIRTLFIAEWGEEVRVLEGITLRLFKGVISAY
jgi:hypothetical protein